MARTARTLNAVVRRAFELLAIEEESLELAVGAALDHCTGLATALLGLGELGSLATQ